MKLFQGPVFKAANWPFWPFSVARGSDLMDDLSARMSKVKIRKEFNANDQRPTKLIFFLFERSKSHVFFDKLSDKVRQTVLEREVTTFQKLFSQRRLI